MLSAKLALGMDGTTTWDDGAIIWRHKESKEAKESSSKADAKPKIFGPGLAVFDKAAFPARTEVWKTNIHDVLCTLC
jgi:hypothetical protein